MENVLEWLEATAKRIPEKVAFTSETEEGSDVEVTFGEVYNLSRMIGSTIIKDNDTTPVGVFSKRAATTPVLFMACVYANRAYAPIDMALPEARIGKILDNLMPNVILVDKESFDSFAKLCKDIYPDKKWDVVVVDFEKGIISKYNDSSYESPSAENKLNEDLIDENLLQSVRNNAKPGDALYIIHTSGSSGRPKGVVTSHESLINYIDSYGDVMGIEESDRFGNQSPLDYIAAIRDIYLPFKYGASSYIIPKKYFMDPNALFTYLNDKKVTAVGWSVSALTVPLSLGAFEEVKLDTLRKICFSGSVMPCSALRVWQENLPDALFVNQYGPTEATASCTYYVVNHIVDESEVLPIGKAYDGYDVFLTELDCDSKVITDEDVEGQITVSGVSLAIGYYNDPDRTNENFVVREMSDGTTKRIYKTGDIGTIHNGMFEFHGRMDRQIKHMGHRVELDEVECAANSVENVTETCCIYKKEKESLILFYSGDATRRDLSLALRELIPGFMVPRKIIQLDKLPKLPNGKIDIKELEER
ncbi:MAG TPA: amino acid adenylation protein [Lachnospiraceae bacterium]|nr:amino acid adenylation protein [Lachnospiraceae bacterium]